MQVRQISLTENGIEQSDWRNHLQIKFNDEVVFDVRDGEVEDANLSRDFADCWIIKDLIKKAYELGKAGEPLEIMEEEVDSFV